MGSVKRYGLLQITDWMGINANLYAKKPPIFAKIAKCCELPENQLFKLVYGILCFTCSVFLNHSSGGIKSKQVKRFQFNRRSYKNVAMHGHAFFE